LAGGSGGPVIQIFGRNDSQTTRRCLRFFKERRLEVSLVDIKRRPPAPGELRRFAQKYGARALLDLDSKAYKKANMGYLSMADDEVFQRVLAEPKLLNLPLVRYGNEVTIGIDEETWRSWHPGA
jgi:arsenate reductase